MSIDFIQQKLSQIDNYLNQIDNKFAAKFKANDPGKTIAGGFANLLQSSINTQEVRATVKATIKQDDFSKLPSKFENYIDQVTHETSLRYGVELPSNLVKSLIKQESGFNPNAKSHAGAEGLMQLMPATAKSVGVHNSMNPYQNLKGGVEYLAQMLQRFDGNLQKSLAAYNAGPQAVERHGDIPPYKETQNYVKSIMRDYLAREDYQSVDMVG
ncbi:MAG: lytic transglycosylase domain-containing protein [Candidatus Melainabacteria bacterium]|jgi:soluble lytic murein transglycosylase-like protein|nr:lytic transglycosylase domain-containing protein [Candidatus Melainabacteria bacterium]